MTISASSCCFTPASWLLIGALHTAVFPDMLDGQTLPQLAKTVLLVILLQFNLLLSWSLITGSAMRKRMRRQRKNNKQNTGKAV